MSVKMSSFPRPLPHGPQKCRFHPRPLPPMHSSREPAPESRSPATTLTSLDVWDNDIPSTLMALYEHTAEHPMRFSLERWQLMLRVSRLIEAGEWSGPYAATRHLVKLRLPRPKLAAALKMWVQSKDRLQLAQSEPRQFQLGRYKGGYLSKQQKLDMAAWTRIRESSNVTLRKTEILTAMRHFILINQGVEVPDDSDHCLLLRRHVPRLNIECVYHEWRHWIRRSVVDYRLHICGSRKAKAPPPSLSTLSPPPPPLPPPPPPPPSSPRR